MTLAVKTSVLLSSSTIFMNPFFAFFREKYRSCTIVRCTHHQNSLSLPRKTEVPKLYESSPKAAPVRNPSPMICNSRVTARFLALWQSFTTGQGCCTKITEHFIRSRGYLWWSRVFFINYMSWMMSMYMEPIVFFLPLLAVLLFKYKQYIK